MSGKQPKRDISIEEAERLNKDYNANLQKAANELGLTVDVSYDNATLTRVALQHITLEEGKRIGVFHKGRNEAVLRQAGEFWAASRLKSPIPAQPSPRTWDPKTFSSTSSSSASGSTSGMFTGSLTLKPPPSVPANPFASIASTSQSQPSFVFGGSSGKGDTSVNPFASAYTPATLLKSLQEDITNQEILDFYLYIFEKGTPMMSGGTGTRYKSEGAGIAKLANFGDLVRNGQLTQDGVAAYYQVVRPLYGNVRAPPGGRPAYQSWYNSIPSATKRNEIDQDGLASGRLKYALMVQKGEVPVNTSQLSSSTVVSSGSQPSAPSTSTSMASVDVSQADITKRALESWKQGKDPKFLKEIAQWITEDFPKQAVGKVVNGDLVRSGYIFYEEDQAPGKGPRNFQKWQERKRLQAKQAEDAENARKQKELADKLAREAEAEKKRQEQQERSIQVNSAQNQEALAYILKQSTLADAIARGYVTPDHLVTPAGHQAILVHKQMMAADAARQAQLLQLQQDADRARLNLTGEISPGPTPDISMIQTRQSDEDELEDDEDSLLDLSENFRRGPPNRNPPTNPEMDEIRRALDKIFDFHDKIYREDDTEGVWKAYISRLGPQRALTATFGHPKVLAKLLPLILPSRAGRINGVVVQQFATFLGENFKPYYEIVASIQQGGDANDIAKFMLDPKFLERIQRSLALHEEDNGKSIEDLFDEWLAGSPSNTLDESEVDPNISGLDYTQQQSLQSSDVASGSTQPPLVQTTEDFIEISFYPDLINAGDQYGEDAIITAQFTARDLLFIAKLVKAQAGFV